MSLLIFAILLNTVQVSTILGQTVSEVCDTRNTTDGKCCAFPFTYRGEIYYECTTRDFGKEWCSLKEDYEQHKQWGFCAKQTVKPIFDRILEATGVNGRSREGVPLFQGDIVMTTDIRNDLRSRGVLVPGDEPSRLLPQGWVAKPQKRPKRAIMRTNRGRDLRWLIGSSGKREVPFEITASNGNDRGVILRAMNHWKEKVKCLNFVSRTRSHSRYLSFFAGGGCFSMVGRQPGSGAQKISIGRGCGSLGIVVHEIGHALGFWHEQSRPDRDNYVTINWENIQRGMQYNFHKYDTSRIDSQGVSYDYDSVMHYSSTAFANRRGVRTIVGKNGRTNLGQRYGLSRKDIQQANLLYCGAQPPVTRPPPKPQTPRPTGCDKTDRHYWCPYWKSRGYCSRDSRHFPFMNKQCEKSCNCRTTVDCNDEHKWCRPWANSGHCQTYKPFMDSYCRKSCRRC